MSPPTLITYLPKVDVPYSARFSVTTPNEIFPFYSCAYILHNYGIILKFKLKFRSGWLRGS